MVFFWKQSQQQFSLLGWKLVNCWHWNCPMRIQSLPRDNPKNPVWKGVLKLELKKNKFHQQIQVIKKQVVAGMATHITNRDMFNSYHKMIFKDSKSRELMTAKAIIKDYRTHCPTLIGTVFLFIELEELGMPDVKGIIAKSCSGTGQHSRSFQTRKTPNSTTVKCHLKDGKVGGYIMMRVSGGPCQKSSAMRSLHAIKQRAMTWSKTALWESYPELCLSLGHWHCLLHFKNYRGSTKCTDISFQENQYSRHMLVQHVCQK